MYHINCPSRRGYLYWDELGCISRALGFPDDTLASRIPDEYLEKDGLTVKDLHQMMEKKYFHQILNGSFNPHSDDWNLRVLKKAVNLINQRVFSFPEMQNIRLAYQIYESSDTRGMHLDQWTILRALKMCNRIIAPLKLMHRIKHMQGDFDEEGRIQLYEFLDLLLWCDVYEKLTIDEQKASGKTHRDLYKLDDFESVLKYKDEKLAQLLNKKFLEEEYNFIKNKKDDEKAVKREEGEISVAYDREKAKMAFQESLKAKHLRHEVRSSQERVAKAQAGFHGAIGEEMALKIDVFQAHLQDNEEVHCEEVRPSTVGEVLRDYRANVKSRLGSNFNTVQLASDSPRPNFKHHVRPKNEPIVTQQELDARKLLIRSLNFDSETLNQKYNLLLNDELEYIKPGISERLKSSSTSDREKDNERNKQKSKTSRPDQAFINYISRIVPARPLPSHGRACDARERKEILFSIEDGLK